MKHLKLFFALFAMLALGVGNAWGAGNYVKVTTAPSDWSGDYLIVYEDGNVAFDGSLTTLDVASNKITVSINDGKIASTSEIDKAKFTIAKSDANYTIKSASGYYIGHTTDANKLSSSTSTQYANSISLNQDGSAHIVASGNPVLRYNAASGNYRFRYFKSSTYTNQKAIHLYKYIEEQSGGETPDPTPTQLAAPTGLTVDAITSSGATLSWNAVADASSYVVTIIDGGSLEKDYPVTGITTTVSDLESSTDYLWTVTAVGDGTNYTNSEESETGEFTTSAPAGGGEGDGEETWTLVTDASTLKADDEIIIAASGDNNYALSTNQKSSNRAGTAITKSGNTLVEPSEDVQILTLKAGSTSGTLALYTGAGYLYAASSSGNQLKTKTTLDVHGSWTISITDGVASIAAKGSSNRNVMQFNPNNGSPIFACYASASQTALAIYKKVTSSGGSEPEPVIVKTLKSIEVTGMTTTFEQGDVFKFDGTCTATYSVTKDGAAQADETAEVTPTDITKPDMSTAGTKEITVTYTEGEITKTVPYSITVENALPKIVITQNEVAEFTNTYAEYTWTASGVSGKIYGYKNSGMQFNSSKAGSYVYNTDPIPGYIRKIKIVKASGTNRNWTPYVSETALTSAEGTVLTQEEVATTTTWEVDGKNSYFYLLEEGGATVIESITISYEAVVPLVAAPTFDPIEGTYNSVQNVTISAEEGTTIHYTLGGQNPTTESPVYSTPIEIAETKTLKAIAVKGEDVSPIASATYTINLPLTTMDQIFAKATAVGSTATTVEIIMGGWTVSGVAGKNVYVTDGTKGFIIYQEDHGFNVGDVLSGTVACKVQLYNGSADLTELTNTTEGLTVTTGGTVTPVEVDNVNTLGGVNTGSVIKITGTCESGNVVAGVKLFGTLYTFDNLTVGNKYNVTGVYLQYGEVEEILPRKQEDIEEVIDIPTATIAIANITMEVGEEKDIEATITPDAAQTTVQYEITAGSEYITLDGTTITAVAAGTATITATIAEVADEYYGTTKTFTVTVKPQNIAELPFAFDGGRDDIETTLGMSQDGLDSDYGSSPKLKFNTTGDYVLIHFNSEPGLLSYDIKGNSFSGGTFEVIESADGETYTEVAGYTELSDVKSEEYALLSTSRFVMFKYTEKSNGNVALGNIKITKPDTRAEAGLAWDPETVTLTVGDAFTAPTLQYPNDVTGTITCESSNEAVATVTAEGVIALGSATGTATITATFAGDANYKPATATCTINVTPVPDNCDGSDDFATDESENPLSYLERTTTAGWKATNAARVTIEDETYFAINGKTTAVGTITSPVLNGGLGSIKIRYANTYSEDNGVSFRLDIKQNGEVVKTYTITKANSEVVKGTVYTEVIENINVAGDFQMVFTNLSPTGSTSNKDRVSIGRLCWTGYEEEETLVLTEGENNLTNGTTGDVTVNRSFEQGKLYTLSLPFALTAAQVKTIFGANTVLYQFAKLAKEGGDLVLYFSKPSAIAAATPYLIEPSQNVNTFVVEDATINTTAKNISFTVDKTTITMKPVLSATATTTNGTTEYWLAADQYLYNNANTLLSLRALFDITTISGSGMPPRCRVALDENVETGVEDIITTDAPVKVIENGQLIIIRDGVKYNVQGQKL